MEKCLQVSSSMVSSTTARASVMHYSHHQSFSPMQDKKVNNYLPNSCKTSQTSAAALSFSARGPRSRAISIVCKASVDQVDFWAPWCGPCRMIAPIIDELAKEYAGKVACYKLNTDESPNVAAKYGIRSIPTVLFFKDGEKKESIIGAVPKSTLSSSF